MARPKKPTYEYVEKLGTYRKRIKDADGKYVALYAKTPKELTQKIKEAERQIEEATFRRNNPTVKEYAEKWLLMQSANIRSTTLADYTSKVNIYIIEPLGDKYMADVTPDDVKMATRKAADKSASIYRSVQMLYKRIFESAYKTFSYLFALFCGAEPQGRHSNKGKDRAHKRAGHNPAGCGQRASPLPVHHALSVRRPAP